MYSYGQAKAGRSARTYIQQLCEDTGGSSEELPEAMNDREKWRERVRDIRASGTTWWYIYIYIYIFRYVTHMRTHSQQTHTRPVGQGCRIHKLNLCKKSNLSRTIVLDITLNQLMVRLQSLSVEKCEVPFIAITPRSTLLHPCNRSNRIIWLFSIL